MRNILLYILVLVISELIIWSCSENPLSINIPISDESSTRILKSDPLQWIQNIPILNSSRLNILGEK